jgi:hypothetical protein
MAAQAAESDIRKLPILHDGEGNFFNFIGSFQFSVSSCEQIGIGIGSRKIGITGEVVGSDGRGS